MRYLSELYRGSKTIQREEGAFLIPGKAFPETLPEGRIHLTLIALGDVGGTLLTGLRLLGGEVIERIGIFDLNESVCARYEAEINQIVSASSSEGEEEIPVPAGGRMPPVHVATDPLEGDAALFCATAGVPPVADSAPQDVRMVQYEANRKIVAHYGDLARKRSYTGGFFIVSDPVDPLCRAALQESFSEEQLRGFGLGVMYGRALYHAADPEAFREKGRVFGPHGEDLVVAEDVICYDEARSLALTKAARSDNLRTRALGYKPYIAPALSSGALSLLALLRGEWQYSSLYFGEAFLGVRNRLTTEGRLVEDLPLADALFDRIETAYHHLARQAPKISFKETERQR